MEIPVDTAHVDGNLVTSRVPADLPAFCRMIVEVLEEQRSGVRQTAGAR